MQSACRSPPCNFQCSWDPSFYDSCWFIDALTVDPTKIFTGETSIWERGTPQPVNARHIEHAAQGSLPVVLVYLACHQEHGCHAFYPFHGAKHGGYSLSKIEEGKMDEGFNLWHQSITPEQRRHIIEQSAYVHPDGLQKRRQPLEDRWQGSAKGSTAELMLC